MIKHIHLPSCESTQSTLKDLLSNSFADENILVSTDRQLKGMGRNGNGWIHFKKSLAFSFTLSPHQSLSLTPLEVGLLITLFIKESFGLKLHLKWPNDILNSSNQKVGGILIQSEKKKGLIVGVGLNFGSLSGDFQFDHFQPGSIKIEVNKKLTPYKLYEYILNNRIENSKNIIDQWTENCVHKDKVIKIYEGQKLKHEGKFLGIGEMGQALIKNDYDDFIEIFSGTLSY